MDSLDKKILLELIVNCRISYRDIAQRINLSPSSVKKRMDYLEDAGFIDRYMVTLHPDFTNSRYATLIAKTDASVKISTFRDKTIPFDGVYMILPFINGNYYVSIEYSKKSELQSLKDLVSSIPGVNEVEVYDVLPPELTAGLPEAPDFTKNELMVLSQLAVDARMMDYDIAANLGWTTKKVKQILDDLVRNQKVAFGLLWNPNLGRDIGFNVIITYDSAITSAKAITDWLGREYPVSYFNSRVVESKSTLFAVFTLERIVEMEPIVMAILELDGITTCYAMTYYNAIIGKTLSRLRLERILALEGLWPPVEQNDT